MFKEKYIAFLKEQLETLTPEGYNVKIIEEYGFGGKLPKHQINCYLKFGVGSKQTNVDRINQPVIFTIISESGDFRIANGIFNDLFYLLSRTHSTLEINNKTFDLWHNYNTPVVQSGIEQVGLNQRKTIIMTGVVSYSLEKIIGVKYRVGTETTVIEEVWVPKDIDTSKIVYELDNPTDFNFSTASAYFYVDYFDEEEKKVFFSLIELFVSGEGQAGMGEIPFGIKTGDVEVSSLAEVWQGASNWSTTHTFKDVSAAYDEGEWQNIFIEGYYKEVEKIGVVFNEVYPINPQTQYNTEAITPQHLNANFGYAEIEGANNTLSFQMLLDKTELSKKLLETSIKGTPLRLALEIKYGEEIGYTFNFPVKVTNVVNSHDNATGDNVLSVTCMPIETF